MPTTPALQERPPIKKPQLLLIPGMLCDHQCWSEILPELEKFARPQLVNLSLCMTLDEMLDTILSQAEDGVLLAGHSMGGYLAQEFAIRYPAMIRGLCFMNVSGRGYTEETKMRHRNLLNKTDEGSFPGLFSQNLDLYLSAESLKKTEIVNTITEMEKRLGMRTYLRQIHATMDRPDLRSVLGRLQVPVLGISGDEDRIVPHSLVQELTQGFENSTYVCFESTGHFPQLEKSKDTASAINKWINWSIKTGENIVSFKLQ